MATGESFYSLFYNRLDESQKQLGTRSSESLPAIINSEVSTLDRLKEDDTRALEYSLTFMDEGPFLIGGISPVCDDRMDELLYMSEDEITKAIKNMRSSISRLRAKMNQKSEDDQKKLRSYQSKLELYSLWKRYGGSTDDQLIPHVLPHAGDNQAEGHQNLSSMVSKKKGSNLYCRYNTLFRNKNYGKTYSPADLFVELNLCFSSTEAACERFFRYLSLIEKKAYRLNLNGTKACQLAVLRYYSSEIYQWMGKGKAAAKTLYDIMYLNDWLIVCYISAECRKRSQKLGTTCSDY